jgi:hypothetical protein
MSCCFFLLLLSAPAPNLVFSMIADCLLCGLAHLEASMSPRPHRPLLASLFCVTVPEGTIHDASLLIEGQTGSMTIGCVSKQVPRASVETERPHIRTSGVGCFVACLTASQSHIPLTIECLVPLARRCRHCEREHQRTHEATYQGPALVRRILA